MLITQSVAENDRNELLEQEVQKLTNKVEILEHEIRLIKQQLGTHDAAKPAEHSPTQAAETKQPQPQLTENLPINVNTSEKQQYDLALATLKDKKYAIANKQFADFIASYPKSAMMDRSLFWYAESFFGQKDFQNAALNYLKCYQKFSNNPKKQDALLKLAMSLSELRRKEEVCKIIKKLEVEFPNRSANSKKISNDLKVKHSCK